MTENYIANDAPSTSGTWQLRPTKGDAPAPRSFPAAVSIRNTIYLFGGIYDPFGSPQGHFPLNDLYSFDTRDHSWNRLSPKGESPGVRGFSASIGVDEVNRFYIFGGATYRNPDYSDFRAHSDLWEYDPESNTWSLLQPVGPVPSPRSVAHLWLVRRTLYLFGGISPPYFQSMNDLWAYDIDSNKWEEIIPNGSPEAPIGRCQVAAGASPIDGKLLIHGGERFDAESGFFRWLPDTWQYDLATGQWSDITQTVTPSRQNWGSSVVMNNSLYLHGGEQPYDRENPPEGSTGCSAPFPQNPTDHIWRFDLKDQVWTKLRPDGDPGVALKRTNSSAVDGVMYIFCGYGWQCRMPGDSGQLWNTDVYSYVP
ncbi:MAG TPA: kelch repeat-containing protein [Streptomyces sp.]